MKRIFIVLILFSSIFLNAQTDKDKAKTAFMEIIECYFMKDCNKFYSYVGDSIAHFGDHFITTKKMIVKKELCNKFDTIIKKTINKKNYLEKYHIDVFSYKEFSTITPKSINDYMIENQYSSGSGALSAVNVHKKLYNENDFLVIGDLPAIKKYENTIGTSYIFVLRKTARGFKIIGSASKI